MSAAFLLGVGGSWFALGQIDSNAYDYIFRLHRPDPWTPDSIILAEDDQSFEALGGILNSRRAFADGLNAIQSAHPRAVALDMILSDPGNPAADDALEAAFRNTPNLVLESHLDPAGERWNDPLPRFRRWAAAVGHVQADPDTRDAINRQVQLEKAAGHDRRWALSLEAFRVSRHAGILESPEDLRVAGVTIPSSDRDNRTMRIRYVPPEMGGIPRVSLKELAQNPALAARFQDKIVFAGVTAQAAGDRWMTPYSRSVNTPGIEIHANAFETIDRSLFLTSARTTTVLLAAFAMVILAALTFSYLDRWQATAAAALILIAAHLLPYVAFTRGVVFPYTPVALTAWLAILAAATWRNVIVRRLLGESEAARGHYREAMQFVTHEMKTPLTAIQGSSELISRYAMPEEKRKQMADMINTESKRLAQMIETFLNVERLTAGQMELKQESFTPRDVIERCLTRVQPLADRKSITLTHTEIPPATLTGDRELMEYAVYNLLTNAIKYSPPETTVTISAERRKSRLLLSVKDQGIGIDPKDARRVFEKFYRTKTAEQSAEKGTGIGLSIVEQIVIQHHGTISLESAVGKGSLFTISLPAAK